MNFNFYVTYFVVVLLVTLIPWTNMFLAVKRGVHYGASLTVPGAFGNSVGNIVIAPISLAGLSAILKISQASFL